MWGSQIQEATGFAAAAEIGIASATFGLICAELIGGPIAKYLIDRNKLHGDPDATPIVGLEFTEKDEAEEVVNHTNFMRGMFTVHVAILLGFFAHQEMGRMGLNFPLFVPCLLVGIIMSNTIPYLFKNLTWPVGTKGLAVISDYCLSIFLAMSLMSMKLCSIAEWAHRSLLCWRWFVTAISRIVLKVSYGPKATVLVENRRPKTSSLSFTGCEKDFICINYTIL